MVLTRRHMISGAVASMAASQVPTAVFARWEPSERYPDPAVEILDPSFAPYRLALARVERLATGFRWSEGPVWFGDGRYLLWSDIPNNRIMKWEEETGRVSVFRKPSNNANGNTRDRQGRLITCEHDTRRVTRTEYDGSITVLADRFEGKLRTHPTMWWSNLIARCGLLILLWYSGQLRRTRCHSRAAHQRVSDRRGDWAA